MVAALFNKDQDGVVSAEEFILGDCLRPHFRENVKVPVKVGDIVGVRDLCMNLENEYHNAVVIGWYQHAHWNHAINIKKKKRYRILEANATKVLKEKDKESDFFREEGKAKSVEMEAEEDDDAGPIIFKKSIDTDNFFFNNGTVFLVRLIENRDKFSKCQVVLPKPNRIHFDLLNKGEIHAIPETAIYWKEIKCNDFVRGMLEQSDWLFDSDGTCAINDHRCVPLSSNLHQTSS